MRKEELNKFKEACNETISFFQKEMQLLEYRPELYAIEILFLELQLLSTATEKSEHNFISKCGEIIQYLKNAPAGKKFLTAFKQNLKKDWEFNFTLNYFFPNYTTKILLEKTLVNKTKN
jgi:hypothetical protein